MVIDTAAPSRDSVTLTSGPVALKGRALARDGGPDYDRGFGTILVEVLAGERVRIEWFDTQGQVTAFTAAARMYER